MTPSFPTFAAIRYGYGLSPVIEPPESVSQMLALLAGPDTIAKTLPMPGFAVRAEEERALGELRKARRQNQDGAVEAYKAGNRKSLAKLASDLAVTIARPTVSTDGFRERLVQFWADHFTVVSRGKGLRYVTAAYIEDAIRPNITGNFRTLLRAVELHPVMLIYLDQVLSFGPKSPIGLKAGRGLNENLAREILELHTLGVGGAYKQTDVREFAKLLTGLNYNFRHGFKFRPGAAEPGAETVLGHSYGGGQPSVDDITAALDDIALHPDTAGHLARKLVVHFISDDPDPDLVAAMAAAYRDSKGELMALYETMLNHPRAWQGLGAKAKKPFDYVVSSLRAFGLDSDTIKGFGPKGIRQYVAGPLSTMGQPFLTAGGPNGFPEEVDHWITPQGLAARIEWALIISRSFGKDRNPTEFARIALADMADADLVRLVGFAESKDEGLALVLASPQFNRR